jgi:hypothetical protein
MPLNTREDCQDKAKVWAELASSYKTTSQATGTVGRAWKKDDLKFMSPTMDKLDEIRPPYTVQMVSSPLADPPAGTVEGDWRYVEIVGTNVASGNKTTIRVGKVWDH